MLTTNKFKKIKSKVIAAVELKVGDTVRLNSGGPLMTIKQFDESGNILGCVWFIGFNVYKANISRHIIFPDFYSAERDAGVKLNYKRQRPKSYEFDNYTEENEEYAEEGIHEDYDEKDDYEIELEEILEEMTDYSDSVVRSKNSGWYY